MGLFSSFKSKSAANVAGPQVSGSGSVQKYRSSEQQAVAGASSSGNGAGPQRSGQRGPLTKGEIRLLILQPGRPNDALQLHVERYWMRSAPDYEAISYTWGDVRNRRQTISVDGQNQSVGQNLGSVLRRIRRPDRARVVWADELCINQVDKDEVGQQLRHMHIIYPQAKRVLCHLGEDDGSIEVAFRVLREWAEAYGDGIKAKDKLKAELVEKTKKQVAKNGPEPRALQNLFQRPWWRRAWTLQEVCVGQDKPPLIICGEHELSWNTFYFACLTMFGALPHAERSTALGAAVIYVLPMLSLCWADKRDMWLSDLIPLVASRVAYRRQDLIFSLLGLTTSNGAYYPPADPRLSEEQVSILYTRSIIKAERRLDIFLIVGQSKGAVKGPSWAINLQNLPGKGSRLQADREKFDVPMWRFRATGSTQPVLRESRNDFDPVLLLGGMPLDTIAGVYDSNDILQRLSQETAVWSDVFRVTKTFSRNLNISSPYDKTAGSSCEAILRVMVADQLFFASRLTRNMYWPQWESLWIAYKRFAQQSGRKGGPRFDRKEDLMQYVREHFPLSEAGKTPAKPTGAHTWLEKILVSEFLSAVRRTVDGRCLFTTRQGYLGLGPASCRQSDEVCLLYGATMPFVLRPAGKPSSNSNHRLLDEAYVEGFMFGEGIVGNRKDRTYALV